jgi:hypothetical protein
MQTLTLERNQEWDVLLSQFPYGWETQAVLTGAAERFQRFSSASNLLRILLLS